MNSNRSAPRCSGLGETSYLNEGLSRVLKISVVESRSERRLILEGNAPHSVDHRVQNCFRKDVLPELRRETLKFRSGVFSKHVLR